MLTRIQRAVAFGYCRGNPQRSGHAEKRLALRRPKIRLMAQQQRAIVSWMWSNQNTVDLTDAIARAQQARLKGDLRTAEQEALQVAASAQQQFGEDPTGHPIFLEVLLEMGLISMAQGKYKDALGYLEQAYACAPAHLDSTSVQVAQILTPLGSTMAKLGFYDIAEGYLEAAFKIIDEHSVLSRDTVPLPRSELDEVFSAIVTCLAAQGKYKECDDRFRMYLRKYHAHFDSDVGLAKLQNNWGLVLEKLGDAKGAKMLYMESLALRERLLGPESLPVASSLANLGKACGALGEYDEALKHLDQAVVITKTVFAEGSLVHIDLLAARASILQSSGAHTEAATVARQLATEVELATFPPEEKAHYLLACAAIFTNHKDMWPTAEEQYKRAVQLLGTVFDEAINKLPLKAPFAQALQALASFYQLAGQDVLAAEMTSAATEVLAPNADTITSAANDEDDKDEAVEEGDAAEQPPPKKDHMFWFLDK